MSKLIIKNEYGTAPNKLLNDEKLSLKAKGMFVFLQSKPNDWKFSVKRIGGQNKDGKSSIGVALKELEKYGVLCRKSTKDSNGKWNGFDYVLSENPFTENPSTEKPSTEKWATLSNIDNSNKDIVKKNIVFNIFWDLYEKKNGLKSKVEKKWNSLTDKDRKNIIDYIPKYKEAQPDKQFRKHPMTFLNNESWKDELISNNKPKKRKVYFQGDPVYEKKGKQWVVSNGEWREFVGEQKDLEIKFE